MSYTIGVLAIGSLYWDNSIRERWRQSRLRKQDEISVAVPIRYGRLSKQGKRRNTYTMVFSSETLGLGKAKILPCANAVASIEDLESEARLLWAAERKCSRPDNTIASNWGCVALLRNPNGNVDDELLDDWAKHVANESDYQSVARKIERGGLINGSGMLQISWPGTVDGDPMNLDLLLATANEPTLEGHPPAYPSAQTVALAWKRAVEERPDDKPDEYFWRNRESGITTFQDDEIEKELNRGGGCLGQLRPILTN